MSRRNALDIEMCECNDYTCDFFSPLVTLYVAGAMLLLVIGITIYLTMTSSMEDNAKIDILLKGTFGQELDIPSKALYMIFLSSQFMVPAIYLAGLQYNFNWTLWVVAPVSLLLSLPKMGHNPFLRKIDPRKEDKLKKDDFEDDGDERSAEIIGQKIHSLKFKPRSVYLDFGIPFYHVALVFTLQVMLLSIYGFGILEQGRPCFASAQTYITYWIGALSKGIYYLLYKVHHDKDSYKEDEELWQQTLFLAKKAKHRFILPKEREKSSYKIIPLEWHLRHAMSYFINSFSYMYVFHFLLFISLAISPPQDFVLNFVEVIFVFGIDNYSTWNAEKEIEIELLVEDQSARLQVQV